MFKWLKRKQEKNVFVYDDTPKAPKFMITLEKFSRIQDKYWVDANDKDFDPSVWCFWKFGVTKPTQKGKWRNPTFAEALHRQYMWHANFDFYVACVGDETCTFQKNSD